MEIKMYKFKYLLTGLILLVLVGCGSDDEKRNNDELISVEIIPKSISYHDEEILIQYPYLTGFGEKELEDSINSVILNDVMSYLQPIKDIPEGQSYNLSYEIKVCDEGLLSIVYTGSEFLDGSPYPVDVFFTTNIDLVNAKKLKLKDFISDEGKLASVYQSILEEGSDNEMTKFAYDYILQTFDKNELISGFNEADETFGLGRYIFSYYTDNSLAISWEVPHVIGDHVETEIPLEELTGILSVEGD